MNQAISNDVFFNERDLFKELSDLKVKIRELEIEKKNFKKIINQYKNLFPPINDPLLLTDTDGRIIDANQQFIDLLGYSLFDLKRMTIKSLTPMNLHQNETKILLEELSEFKNIKSRWCEFYKITGQKISVQLSVNANYDENENLESITRIVKSIL